MKIHERKRDAGNHYGDRKRKQTRKFIYFHVDTICEPRIFEKLVAVDADITLLVDYKKYDDEAMKIRSKNGKIRNLWIYE